MRTIKFSHYYRKMKGFDLSKSFKLISINKTHYKYLDQDFIDYDTEYEGGYYTLQKTDLLILWLKQNNSTMTTIRRWTPTKEQYYRKLVGQQIACEIIDLNY